MLDFFVPEGRKKSKTESSFKCAADHAYEGEGVRCGESMDQCEQFEEEVSDEATLNLHKTLCIASHSSVLVS